MRVFLGCDSQTGKRRYANKTIHGTQKDAQKYLNAKLREIDLGVYMELANICLSQYHHHGVNAA